MWKSRPFSPAASGRPRNYRGFRTLVPGIWGTFFSPARPLIKSENVDGFSRLVFLLFMRGDSCRKFPENFPLNTGKFCPPFSREMPVPAREPLPVEKWILRRGIPVQARLQTGLPPVRSLQAGRENRGENAHFARMLRIRSSMMPRSWGLVFIRLSTFLIV